MRDMEAGQSDHTVGLLTPVDASARGVDQPQHHDNLPELAASRQSKHHEMDCFDYFCRHAELLVHCNYVFCLRGGVHVRVWPMSPYAGGFDPALAQRRALNLTTAITALLCLVANLMALYLYSPAKARITTWCCRAVSTCRSCCFFSDPAIA